MNNTIAIHYVVTALKSLSGEPETASRLLEECRIPEQLLSEPRSRVSTEQYIGLMLRLIQHTRDEFIRYDGFPRTRPGTFTMMCHGVINEPDLRSALLRGIHFYNTLLDDLKIRLTQQGDSARLSLHWRRDDADPDHMSTECVLTIVHRFASWLVGQRIPLIDARFQYATPSHVDEYRKLFTCPLHFEQPYTGLQFNSHFLSQPILQNEQTLKAFLKTAPSSLMVVPNNDGGLTAEIRAIIGKSFSEEFPDFETVASELHTTPQTLRRRLKDEGTSYQEIKDNIRRDAAIYYLTKPNLSITEITHLMGFSEPSTFHRAFKKWTGLTPGEYRQGVTHKSQPDVP